MIIVRLYQGVLSLYHEVSRVYPGCFRRVLDELRRWVLAVASFVGPKRKGGGSKPVNSKLPATQRATAGFPVILCSNFRRLIRRDSPMSIRCCLLLELPGVSTMEQLKPVP